MTAAIYARFSTEDPAQESIADQIGERSEKAAREGFIVVAQIMDEAISGRTTDRPGYQALLEDAKLRNFDIIVAAVMMRLWREDAEQWRAIKEWIDHNIASVTVSVIDSRQPNFAMIASVMGASAELDGKETGFRTRRGPQGQGARGLADPRPRFRLHLADRMVEAQAPVAT